MSKKDVNSQDLYLKEMSFKELVDRVIIVFVSKRGGGKSFACVNYLYEKRYKPLCIVISGTEKLNGTYSKCVPKPFIYTEYSKELMENIMKRQLWAINYAKTNPSFDPDIIIVLDDLFADPRTFRYDIIMNDIFLNGRHYGITLLVCTQYLKLLSPALRNNIDYLLVFKTNNEKDINLLKEEYGDIIKNKETFHNVLSELTNKNGIMMFKQKKTNPDEIECIENKIYHMKASPVPDFMFGDKFTKNFSRVLELNEKRKEKKEEKFEEKINKTFYENNTKNIKINRLSIKPLDNNVLVK